MADGNIGGGSYRGDEGFRGDVRYHIRRPARAGAHGPESGKGGQQAHKTEATTAPEPRKYEKYSPATRAPGSLPKPAREKETITMSEDKIIEIIEQAATIAAQAAAKAAVAAVQAVLGAETQNAMETAITEAARVGAEIGAQASVKAVERERKKFRDARSDRRFRNTKYLLRNYNMLAKHCSNAVYDRATDLTHHEGIEDILELLDEMLDEGIQVESIMKSAPGRKSSWTM